MLVDRHRHPSSASTLAAPLSRRYRRSTAPRTRRSCTTSTVKPADLRAHTRQALTPYKVPRWVVVVDELPTNRIGKVLRREVATLVRES